MACEKTVQKSALSARRRRSIGVIRTVRGIGNSRKRERERKKQRKIVKEWERQRRRRGEFRERGNAGERQRGERERGEGREGERMKWNGKWGKEGVQWTVCDDGTRGELNFCGESAVCRSVQPLIVFRMARFRQSRRNTARRNVIWCGAAPGRPAGLSVRLLACLPACLLRAILSR